MDNKDDDLIIIHSYTTEQAFEDGILHPIHFDIQYCGKPINAITDNAFTGIVNECNLMIKDGESILGDKIDWLTFEALIKHLVGTSKDHPDSDEFMGVTKEVETMGVLWIVRNEIDGYTMMLPDDY